MKLKIKGGAFKNLKMLGEEVMQQIDSRLLTGESTRTIAAWIQDDLGKLKDIQLLSLEKTLRRYRETELRNRTLERITQAQKGAAVSTVQKRLNALEELDELARLQRARIDKMLMREQDLPNGILLKDTAGEMRLLKDTLTDLGRLQLETGLLVRAPKTVKGQLTRPDGTTETFEWTEEQEQMFRELEQAEQHAAESA